MEIEKKIEFLNSLGTGKLIADLHEAENKLEQLQTADAKFRNENVRYLASYGEDCADVKGMLADLVLDPPVMPDAKKPTVAQLEAWLRQQRTSNKMLAEAISRQNKVIFIVENNRIYIDVAKKRLESLKAIIGLRTAQIEFLK